MIRFEPTTIAEGQRLADHLLKACKQETPPAAMIALAMCLVVAADTAGVNRRRLMELIELFDDDLKGGQRNTAQEALSSLILPTSQR